MANSSAKLQINLLKSHRVLSEKDYIKEYSIFKLAIVSLIVAIIVVLSLGAWNWIVTRELLDVEKAITAASNQIKGLAKANAEHVYVKSRLNLVNKFMDEQEITRESLQQVLSIQIPGLAVGGIIFEDDKTIKLTMIARDQVALSQAIDHYKKNEQYFSQVSVESLSRDANGRYEMTVKLLMPQTGDKV